MLLLLGATFTQKRLDFILNSTHAAFPIGETAASALARRPAAVCCGCWVFFLSDKTISRRLESVRLCRLLTDVSWTDGGCGEKKNKKGEKKAWGASHPSSTSAPLNIKDVADLLFFTLSLFFDGAEGGRRDKPQHWQLDAPCFCRWLPGLSQASAAQRLTEPM